GRGEFAGRAANRHQGHEAAVGTAGDTDAVRVDVAGRDEKLLGRDLVLEIGAAQILEVGDLEGFAVAARAARIGLDDDVAARGQRRRGWTELVDRLARRSAVCDEHSRVASVAL